MAARRRTEDMSCPAERCHYQVYFESRMNPSVQTKEWPLKPGFRSGHWGSRRQTLARAIPAFDHLVGAGEKCRRHSQADSFCGFHVDDQLELRWLLDGQVGRLGAFKDLIDITRTLAVKVNFRGLIGHQPTVRREPANY